MAVAAIAAWPAATDNWCRSETTSPAAKMFCTVVRCLSSTATQPTLLQSRAQRRDEIGAHVAAEDRIKHVEVQRLAAGEMNGDAVLNGAQIDRRRHRQRHADGGQAVARARIDLTVGRQQGDAAAVGAHEAGLGFGILDRAVDGDVLVGRFIGVAHRAIADVGRGDGLAQAGHVRLVVLQPGGEKHARRADGAAIDRDRVAVAVASANSRRCP